jgi:phosphoenolpyruvate carboxykinase (GTP)
MTDFTPEQFNDIMVIDRELWKQEMLGHEELFEKLYDKIPKEFLFMKELLLSSLWRSPAKWGMIAEREED